MKYKVGDRVRIKSLDWYNTNKDKINEVKCGVSVFIPAMTKHCGYIRTISKVFDVQKVYHLVEDNNLYTWTDEMIEGLVQEMPLDKAGQITDFEYEGLAYTLPDGYQFTDENGNVINATKIVLEKKKEYPKTFEECCKILGFLNVDLCFNPDYRSFDTSKEQWKRLGLMNQFYQLLICRDAYWKIAGEEMGLGKPWEPDWTYNGATKYCIGVSENEIQNFSSSVAQYILAFPTEEMRDTFYENFKKEIEMCKELL